MYMYYVSVYIYKYTYISDIAKQLMSTHRVCVYIYYMLYIYYIYIIYIHIYNNAVLNFLKVSCYYSY